MDFTNKIVEGIHYSRFAASWIKAGGKRFDYEFEEWLSSLVINDRKLRPAVVREIRHYAENGKLELEANAAVYISKKGL